MEPQPTPTAVSPETEPKQTQIPPRGFTRCRAQNRSGSRCRKHAGANGFCALHANQLNAGPSAEDRDLSSFFSCSTNEFQSAVQINAFLSTVVDLVVKNEMSARRAAVLAYITNQLLRTLPVIDYETSADQPQHMIVDLPRPGCDWDEDDDPEPEPSPSIDPLAAYKRLAS